MSTFRPRTGRGAPRWTRLRRSTFLVPLALLLLPVLPSGADVGNPGTDLTLVADGFLRFKSNSFDFSGEDSPECSDSFNNGDAGQDLAVDFPSDPQCTSAADDSEIAGGFQPQQSIQLIGGAVTGEGALTFPSSGFTLPALYLYVDGAEASGGLLDDFVATLRFSPTADVTGSVDPETGAMSLRLRLRLDIDGGPLSSGCRIDGIDINSLITGTTLPPGPNTPTFGTPYNYETGRAHLVNNSFSVPGAQGCGSLFLGAVNLNDEINTQLGLPSAAGNNEAQLTVEFVGTRPQPPSTNTAPSASDQSLQTAEDSSVSITLDGADPESQPLSFDVDSGPSNGTLNGTAPSLTYTPAPDFHGEDTFTYRVTDTDGASDTGVVTITVSPVNDPPVATDLSTSTTEDTPVMFTLVATDVDDATLAYAVGQQPTHGAVSVVGDQATYTPSTDFSGVDSFSFSVTDPSGVVSNGTVSLTVSEAPKIPTSVAAETSNVQRRSLAPEGTTSLSGMLTAANGVPLAGRALTFAIGQRLICSATTGTNGQATCSGLIRRSEVARTPSYTATFAGDNDYASSSATAALVLTNR